MSRFNGMLGIAVSVLAVCNLCKATESTSEPTWQTYGYSLPLILEGPNPSLGPVYELTLPVEVYQHTARNDLGDVRVVNAQGEVLPYSIALPAMQQVTAVPVSVPLYPLYGTESAQAAIKVSVAAGDSTVVLQRESAPATRAPISAYVLDARSIDKPLSAIELVWPRMSDAFSASIALEASDDLGHWRPVAAGLPIANLVFNGQQLLQRRVEFVPTQAKFYRLTWSGMQTPLLLEQVMVQAAAEQVAAARLQLEAKANPPEGKLIEGDEAQSNRASGNRTVGNQNQGKQQEFLYDLNAHAPVDRINLGLPQANTYVQAEIASRDSTATEWRMVANSSVYDLQGATPLRNAALMISPNADRYWRVRITGSLGQGAPVLQASWTPQLLTFIARGEPPFQLVFGHATAQPADTSLQAWLGNNATRIQPSIARTGALQTLAGDAALHDNTRQWKPWLLWGVLLLAVATLARMAWGMAKELKSNQGGTNGPTM